VLGGYRSADNGGVGANSTDNAVTFGVNWMVAQNVGLHWVFNKFSGSAYAAGQGPMLPVARHHAAHADALRRILIGRWMETGTRSAIRPGLHVIRRSPRAASRAQPAGSHGFRTRPFRSGTLAFRTEANVRPNQRHDAGCDALLSRAPA
jgi:hypothetical protein